MSITERTAAGHALTALMLNLLRVANRMMSSGDKLVASLGLTSARWQVLGSISAAQRSRPVAWLARDMGANRQNVQRIVNDLAADGLVAFAPNPHHKRAQLVVLTDKGRDAFDAAMRLQAPWINRLSEGLRVEDIAATHAVLATLQQRLGADGGQA